jgi:RHS repeat-associated protein
MADQETTVAADQNGASNDSAHKDSSDNNGSSPSQSPFTAPQISLPKGGGAIRGIGEKFVANPVTGTGSLTVPIARSPGRSGFGPELSLSYDSGTGNGPFGMGCSLGLPSIARKTDKGLPRYADAGVNDLDLGREESDVFILSGAEDLVPLLRRENCGEWAFDEFEHDGYGVKRYRPRVEGLFARVERWTRLQDGDAHWRSISKDNVLTVYGFDAKSRIFDPSEPSRVFSWLICQSYDDKGNAIVYEYVTENDHGVDLTKANERNRVRTANRYLKRIRYGNRKPLLLDVTAPGCRRSHVRQPDFETAGWMFEAVFDYDDGHYRQESPDGEGKIFVEALVVRSPECCWPVRKDPFSNYRSGFEVRTYRLCRRVLMFHHFPEELSVDDYLVRSTEFEYRQKAIGSFMARVVQSGYTRQADGRYLKSSLPALELTYSSSPLEDPEFDGYQLEEVDSLSLENLPEGIDGSGYRLVDLDGEGISGVLSEQGPGWFYKHNLGQGKFGATENVPIKPSLSALNSGRQQLLDLAGDGNLDLVELSSPVPGFYQRTLDEGWAAFRPFRSFPSRDWDDPNLKFVDVTGDGIADVLITQDDAFTWHPSLLDEGFGEAVRVHVPYNEEKGPRVVFADGTQSIYLADMSGDGLSDLVRIRNGEVCYWPNRGYGRFGAKVTMDRAPWFEEPDLFEQRRIRLSDTDGSGTTDIVYLARDGVRIFLNETGNGWSGARLLKRFPATDDISSVSILDFLGRGTACLLWSSALPGDSRQPLRYVDLMCGQKPHLLTRTKNNLGAETTVQYATSTEFYLADKLAGTPWVTRLAFPVQVVKRVETYDWVSRNRFVTGYTYHHGYFDGPEREFRGFGRVDQLDTEELAALTSSGVSPVGNNETAASNVPPVLTKTWFHTGAYLAGGRITRQYEHEYYREGEADWGESALRWEEVDAMLLDDTILPEDLTPEETREACRALKGSMLRQEVYALDGTPESRRPYTVSESNFTVRLFQPRDLNWHAVFFKHARETIAFNYERKLYKIGERWLADPRVSHTLFLAVDDYGNVLESAAVGYGRRYDDPDPWLKPGDRADQRKIHVTCTESSYTNPILELHAYRIPLSAEVRTYELIEVRPERDLPCVTNLFRFEEMVRRVRQAEDGNHDLPYQDIDAIGATQNHPYRRLIECARTLYRKNDLSAGLPLARLESLALPFEGYKLAFTPGLFEVYRREDQNLLPDLVSVMRDEGAYVLSDDQKALGLFPCSDPDGFWWIPSGKVFYSPHPEEAAGELVNAEAHFFVGRRYKDPFGSQSKVFYDPYDLLLLETEDAVHNKVIVGEWAGDGTVQNGNDYRVLQPAIVTDQNGNRSAAAFDALGLVVGSAVMGKTTERLGDSLSGFRPDLTQRQIDQFYSDPRGPVATELLGSATTRIVYDLNRFLYSPGGTDPASPAYAASIVRETHVSDLEPGEVSKLQVGIGYSDGFGRVIQSKLQAEPGPLEPDGPFVDPRWVGSGWTIFNNKGKPVRKYEPFFDDTHEFKFGLTIGVSPILFYDPVGRAVATLHPDHSWEKVIFDPWLQYSWDVNDTVLISDPAADPDAGPFFRLIATTDYLPTWYKARIDGTLGDKQQEGAEKAAAHARTPTTTVFDTLGRTFLTITFNRYPDGDTIVESHDRTLVDLDIEGNQRSVTDALSRKIMVYAYDMLSTRIRQYSVDAGTRWMLKNAVGKALRKWDNRTHRFRYEYDPLQRPLNLFVQTGAGSEQLAERVIYGEGQPEDLALNLRAKVFQQFDQAGVVTNNAYDFKGNLLSTSRRLLRNYRESADWSQAPRFENETFTASTTYDALNRPVTSMSPDGSVIRPTFNETNLLQQIAVNLRRSTVTTPFVTNIEYNAKAQRELIEYGNGARTMYAYDPETFRLIHLATARRLERQRLQDLTYIYDPAGNITQIGDSAQEIIYFRNQVVTPSSTYDYDAIYRLIRATGREHLGQSGGQLNPPRQVTENDSFRMNLPQPGEGRAMGKYTEHYRYDAVGNILSIKHATSSGGWTRHYQYDQESNRLRGTSLPGDLEEQFSAKYDYDADGNMVRMPHLPSMHWDFKDQLQATQRQTANNESCERTYYVYDRAGLRVRKVTDGANGRKKQERIYIGNFEVYREYSRDSKVGLERETLHLMDDKRRLALVETKTVGKNATTGPVTRYQFDSLLGSAVLELDQHAKIISYEEYYPYGSTSYQAVRHNVEVSPKRYRYTGKERDQETEFYYCMARYYLPWLGRWTSTDPKGIEAGMDLYCYSKDNPIILQDPTGLDPEPPASVSPSPQSEAPAASVVKTYDQPATPPRQPKDSSPKDAGSSANLQYLTNGNQPGQATLRDRTQDEIVGSAGLTLTLPKGGKLDASGASSLIQARRTGLFSAPGGFGAEYGVYASGSLLAPSPQILQGTLHIGDPYFGVYLQLGQQSDPTGKNLGAITNITFAQGASSSDQQRQLYVNEIVSESPQGQVAGRDVTNFGNATLLVGGVYTPTIQADSSSDSGATPGASLSPDADMTKPTSGDSLQLGPRAYGAELSATINSGTAAGGAAQSLTGTALVFLTQAFNGQQGLFGVSLGASYETGGGGFTAFLRIGIGFDRPASAAKTAPFLLNPVQPPSGQ